MFIKDKAIGVFDSGLGGISVLCELRKWMPNENYIYYGDSLFAPYGIKTKEEITQRCIEVCTFLIQRNVKAIVIACNTATSACVTQLRLLYPDLLIIGMEPALKLAVDGRKRQRVIVMATDFTLKEKKFHDLMARYSEEHDIYRLPAPKLVDIVEHDKLEDQLYITKVFDEYFKDYDLTTIDCIVLGCTHFVFFKTMLVDYVGNAIQIVDGNAGTSRHVKELLEDRNEVQDTEHIATVELYNSSKDEFYVKQSTKLLDYKN